MNPLVSEMLDAFKILDPSDGCRQGSESQIYRRGSMNPLVSEMLDVFRVLDPSDGA